MKAGCRCGAVQYAIDGPPRRVSYCHCADCRAQTGAPVSVFVGVERARVRRLGAEPTRWGPSEAAARLFCATCGAQIAYEDRGLPDEIHFMLGAIEGAERLAPGWHAFAAERLPWFETADDLPRHPGFTVERRTERRAERCG